MALIIEQQPSARFLLPAADAGLRTELERMIAEYPSFRVHVTLFDGRSHDCLEAADVVLVASGTATLEAALFKKPMVIAYKMPPISAWIMRRKGTIPFIGLPNILAGEFLVPELVQEDATPPAVSRAVLDWLQNPARCKQVEARFTEMHHSLKRDTARLVTDAIFEVAQTKERL